MQVGTVGVASAGKVGGSADPQTAKLKDGAQQFEAMLLGEMLKPLHFGSAGGEGEQDDSASGTVESFGVEALSKSIAKGGGFGIARQIIRQVTAEQEARQGSDGGTKV